jgi:hypothetical protein
MLSEIASFAALLWVGGYDIKNHAIRNLELITLLLLIVPKYWGIFILLSLVSRST